MIMQNSFKLGQVIKSRKERKTFSESSLLFLPQFATFFKWITEGSNIKPTSCNPKENKMHPWDTVPSCYPQKRQGHVSPPPQKEHRKRRSHSPLVRTPLTGCLKLWAEYFLAHSWMSSFYLQTQSLNWRKCLFFSLRRLFHSWEPIWMSSPAQKERFSGMACGSLQSKMKPVPVMVLGFLPRVLG